MVFSCLLGLTVTSPSFRIFTQSEKGQQVPFCQKCVTVVLQLGFSVTARVNSVLIISYILPVRSH